MVLVFNQDNDDFKTSPITNGPLYGAVFVHSCLMRNDFVRNDFFCLCQVYLANFLFK